MKKITMLLFGALLACCLCACGSEATSDQGADEATQQEETVDPNNNIIGDFEVVIGEAEICKDDDGNDNIIFEYSFTNNSPDTYCAMTGLMIKAFQDGIELDLGSLYSENYPRSEWVDIMNNDMKDIKTGVTIDCVEDFALLNTESPVEIEITNYADWSIDTVITKTFTINQ